MTKHLIIGLGLVGSSFLRLLVEQNSFDCDSFFCIDSNPNALTEFVKLGGRQDHFRCLKITESNYKEVLQIFSVGDYVFDFSCEVKNLDMLLYSLEHNLHYISTADSNWDLNDPNWVSAHQHFLEYRKIAKYQNKGTYTSIIEFGMNPGLISCFAKKCLKTIIETDNHPYISRKRDKLLYLLNKRKYGVVAQKIGLEYIIEVDNDNQSFDIKQEDGCIYSPWNPLAFYHEMMSAPEMIFGTWKQFCQFQKVRDCDFFDFYVSLLKHGCDCKEHTFSPQGKMTGSLITHEEIYSMSYYFRHGLYKPSSFFVYKPCELAEQSISANKSNKNLEYIMLDRNKWQSGGESVGVILQGKRFHSAYYGNYLDGSFLNETATIRQVSASTFAAYKYIQNHPRAGFLFPEDVDDEEALEVACKYIGENIFIPCDPVKPCFGNASKRNKTFMKNSTIKMYR